MEKPFKSSQPRFICVFAMKREKFERSCQAISKKKNWIRFLERPTSFRLKLLLIHFVNFVSFSRWTFRKKYIEIRKLIFFFVKCHANSWDTDSGEYGEPRRSNSIEGPEIKIDDTDFLVFCQRPRQLSIIGREIQRGVRPARESLISPAPIRESMPASFLFDRFKSLFVFRETRNRWYFQKLVSHASRDAVV